MDQVPVLGVLQAEQRAVGRKPAAEESTLVEAADANGFGRPIDLRRRVAVERDVDCESVTVADSGRHDSGGLGETLVPAMRNTVQKRSGLPSRERLHEPAAGLIAGLVLEPQDLPAIESRRPVDHADDAVGHLTALAARRLPGIQLPDARLV